MTYREKMIHALETVPVHDGVIRMSEEVRDKIIELLKEQPKQRFFVDSDEKITPLPIQSQWISVEDKLPENAKHLGAFCPKYYVQTEFGMTEGWYNPDRGKWYVLLWFIYAQPGLYLPRFVDLDHGDIPLVSDKVKVSHWMPLPEPPKEVMLNDQETQAETDPEDHHVP